MISLTFGFLFNAFALLLARLTNAFTAFFSSSWTPPRKALRIPAFVKTALILCGLRSTSRRNFLSATASGCQNPPPCLLLADVHPKKKKKKKSNQELLNWKKSIGWNLALSRACEPKNLALAHFRLLNLDRGGFDRATLADLNINSDCNV